MPQFIDRDGVDIFYYVWEAAHPKAVVQIAHGVGEYALRYALLAERLVANGYTVYANDHRGHGQTGLAAAHGDTAQLGKLGTGGLPSTMSAIVQLTKIIATRHPTVPIVLLGHSWGSFMVQRIIDTQSLRYDGMVLTGTAYRTFHTMHPVALNKRWNTPTATGHEWLSRDEDVGSAFKADPLTFDGPVLKLFGLRNCLLLYGRPARNIAKNLSLLIMVGSDDPLGGEKSVRVLGDAYVSRSGFTDVSVVAYDGARHEIFNETNRDEVIADLIAWLNARFTPVNFVKR